MGAWGYGIFENDTAQDWVYDLIEGNGLDLIYSVFNQVMESYVDENNINGFLEEPLGSEALAAAGIIAVIKGNHFIDLPSIVEKWVKNDWDITDNLISLAKEVIMKVKNNSELQELWSEGDPSEWLSSLDNLYKMLL